MTNLPAIPKAGTAIALADMERMEHGIAQQVALINDVDTLLEWRSQAAALEQYLRGKELNGPMLGAQRRVEARIGQLLGECSQGERPEPTSSSLMKSIPAHDRQRFRVLARGLEGGLADDEWRSARDPLLKLIQERFPVGKSYQQTVVQANGTVKKPRAERVKEIRTLSERGMNAEQIAEEIGINENTVRVIASEEGVPLSDFTIGRRAKLDSKRILTETINGVDAYVGGLTMLDDVELPDLEPVDRDDLMQALNRSINGLRKLKNRMEKAYARSDATAA